MRVFKQCIALIAVFLLAACSQLTDLKESLSESIFGVEEAYPPAELTEIKATLSPRILWSAQLGDAEKYDFTPATEGNYVYAASASGEIVKLDSISGKQAWRVDAGQKISGGTGVGANLVLVGTPKGEVLAYDQGGKFIWKAKVSSEVLSAPKVAGDIVVVRAGDSRIFGLNVVDGTRKWTYERNSPALTIRSSAGVLVDSGLVYAGFAGGKLVVLRAEDGRVGWEATVAQPKGTTEIERIADITSLPAVDGPVVYAVAFQGRIAGVDRNRGKVIWNRDISSYTGLQAADSRVYVSHSLGAAYSLDNTNGKTYWRQGDLAHRKLTAPLSLEGSSNAVAFGDFEGYVHFLNKEDGAIIGRTQIGGEPVMPQMIEVSPGILIAQTRGGGLYAVSAGGAVAPSQASQPRIKDSQPEHTDVPQPVPESTSTPQSPAPDEQRSIMFTQDPMAMPATPAESAKPDRSDGNNSAPGIQLPTNPAGTEAAPE